MAELKNAALLSVSNKANIVPVAEALVERGITILSTGGTAGDIRKGGIPVTEVSEYTGFPEIMDGRVKTLHPWIYAGMLFRPGVDEQTLIDNGILYVLRAVICNLYPFEDTVKKGCSYAEATEQIDIGGPTMIRASAKNENFVFSVTHPNQYDQLIKGLDLDDERIRQEFSLAAFEHTAAYDTAIAQYKREQLAA